MKRIFRKRSSLWQWSTGLGKLRTRARALVSDSIEWNSIRRPKVFFVTDTILPSFDFSLSHSLTLFNVHSAIAFSHQSYTHTHFVLFFFPLFYLPIALCLGICTAISSEQGLCAFSPILELIGRQICLSIFFSSFEQWNWFRPTKVLQPLLLHWILFEYQCSSLFSPLLSSLSSSPSSSTFEYLLLPIHRFRERWRRTFVYIRLTCIDTDASTEKRAHILYT